MTPAPRIETEASHQSALDKTHAQALREGFTTGTAATAAALAAARLLLEQIKPSDNKKGAAYPKFVSGAPLFIRTPLPSSDLLPNHTPSLAPHPDHLNIAIAECRLLNPRTARAEVIKDGGDDPDATHGMVIVAEVSLFTGARPCEIILCGGEGIGRVSLPGLPLPVGAAAINPAPREQLRTALADLAKNYGYNGGFYILLRAPEGEARARHTLNARLGIVGGISILGTSGKVRPYSHAAWEEVIRQGAAIAWAQGLTALGLATGRRSERLLMAAHADWPEQAFIQMADFAAMSVRAAVKIGFRHLAIGLYIGKLLKIAQGLEYTHAHTAPLDLTAAANLAKEAGFDTAEAKELRGCNTAQQALALALRSQAREAVLAAWVARAGAALKKWSGPDVTIEVHLFDFDGAQLRRASF